MKIRRMAYALGAEVTEIDLRQTLDDAAIAEIRQAMLDHLVLCFPNQPLAPEQLTAFGARFGEIRSIPLSQPDQMVTPIVEAVTNQPLNGKPWDGYKNGQIWHSDSTYTLQPPGFAFLNAKKLPPAGGDTIFSNQYTAYETLSPTMRGVVDKLSAIHDRNVLESFEGASTMDETLRKQMIDASEKRMVNSQVPIVQPLARVHPETKRKLLYLAYRMARFVGMTVEESKPLLDFFMNHATRYENTYRHRWTVDDLIIWDNRSSMHIALCDYNMRNDPRIMYKCSVKGELSGHAFTPEDDERAAANISGELTPA